MYDVLSSNSMTQIGTDLDRSHRVAGDLMENV